MLFFRASTLRLWLNCGGVLGCSSCGMPSYKKLAARNQIALAKTG